ncbi:unnamed protein product [Diabrotica balteata]|uniref:E3 ubiquitin-protein ligase n=1 Tax=Diabrotica balteata TaxID=107213 RepID=A0A9N9SRI6_DIABA|nr:unnamed protein product [Diabrotica balteata]
MSEIASGNLFCDDCDELLTVKPIKVYSDGKTKCGRCDKQCDNFTDSTDDLKSDTKLRTKIISGTPILSFEGQIFSLKCAVCTEIFFGSENEYRECVWNARAEKAYHLICNGCKLFQHAHQPNCGSLDYIILKGYKYVCMWGCKKVFTSKELLLHQCENERPRECPCPGCSFKGTLRKIKQHFFYCHRDLIFFSSYIEIPQCTCDVYCYIPSEDQFVRLEFSGEINQKWAKLKYTADVEVGFVTDKSILLDIRVDKTFKLKAELFPLKLKIISKTLLD